MRVHKLLENYRLYKETGERGYGLLFATELYRILSLWIEQKRAPEESFINHFTDFFFDMRKDKSNLVPEDLIDMGLVHLVGVIYRYAAGEPNRMDHFLNEARLPFYAFIDEEGYRSLKKLEFTDIDFAIFDLIEGEFPHDAACNFITTEKHADIWMSIRYADSLDDESERLRLIEALIDIKSSLVDKLILAAYVCYIEPERVKALLASQDVAMEEHEYYLLPEGIHEDIIKSLLTLSHHIEENEKLPTNYESMIDPRFFNEIHFALLTGFCLSQQTCSLGWITLLESGIRNFWQTPLSDSDDDDHDVTFDDVRYPMVELTVDILTSMETEDLKRVVATSLLVPNFFESIHQYGNVIFDEFLTLLSAFPEILQTELRALLPEHVSLEDGDVLMMGRLQKIAYCVGKRILVHKQRPILVDI